MKTFYITATQTDPNEILFAYYFRAECFMDILQEIASWKPHPFPDLLAIAGDYTLTIGIINEDNTGEIP